MVTEATTSKKDPAVNVLYQFNDKYAPFAGISITSLLENNRHIPVLELYLLAEDVSEENREKLRLTAAKYGRPLHFLDVAELLALAEQAGLPTYRGSQTANMKLFLPMLLKEVGPRLLYIDSDSLVVGDIAPLFRQDLQGHALGMCLDSLGRRHKRLLGLDADEDYYNTGVMLFDMPCWQTSRCSEQMTAYAQQVRAHFSSPDQDLVNMALRPYILRLDAPYNLQPIHLVFPYRMFCWGFGQKNYYTEQQLRDAAARPVILHFFRFLGQFPWDEGSLHPDTALFEQYRAASLWRDRAKTPDTRGDTVFRIERWLYRHLPTSLFFFIFKFSYDFFIWKAEMDSRRQRNSRAM